MTATSDRSTDLRLLRAIQEFVTKHPSPDVQRFHDGIANWGTEWRAVRPRHLNASDTLVGMPPAVQPELAALLDLFIRHRANLHWEQAYSALDAAVGNDMLSNYGYAEIIGKHGPFVSQRVRSGIALYGPGLTYPPHYHQAEEIYALLAGSAMCSLGDGPTIKRRAGDILYHAPHVAHGLQTTGESLVIFYLWQGGDLREKPSFV